MNIFDFQPEDIILLEVLIMEDWITTAEAAQVSGYHVEYVRKLVKARKIEARKWMRDWQVSRESLEAYLDQMKVKGEKRGPKPQGN